MTPVDQDGLVSSWHLGLVCQSSIVSPPDSPPPKTIAEASDTVSSCTASLSSPGISDVQRHVTESRAVVKVHAVSDDGTKSCSFEFDAGQSNFSDFRSMIGKGLHIDDFICTYSTSPQFLAMRSVNPYRQQMLNSDLELSCAVVTTCESACPPPMLYIRAHHQLSGDLLSMSAPRRMRTLTSASSYSGEWDLLEDSKDVQRLWDQLPPAVDVPFARILRCHQVQRISQVTRTVQGFTHRLPLQAFEWSQFFDHRGRLVKEADFRLRVYHGGITGDLRQTAWRHLLYVYPPHLTSAERTVYLEDRRAEYFALRNAWKDQAERTHTVESLLTTIHNDVVRTDRTLEPFVQEDGPYLTALYNILVTFALNDAIISYVQGMNDLTSVLLRVFEGNEADTYIAFHSLMQCSKSLFTPDGLSLKSAHLKALLQRYDAVFYDYLCKTHSQDLFFTYRWLLLDMKREVDSVDVLRLFEVLWSTLPPPPHYTSDLHSHKNNAGASAVSDHEPSEAQSINADVAVMRKDDSAVPNIAVAVRDYPYSPTGDTWAVIDCLPSHVQENKASEVSPHHGHDPAAPVNAQDTTVLGASVESRPETILPVGSAGSSDWTVLSSPESEQRKITDSSEKSLGDSAAAAGTVVKTPLRSGPIAVTRKSDDKPDTPTGLEDLPAADAATPDPMYYGSPLTLFVCLAVMLEHRDKIMQGGVVEESIAIYFDHLRGHYDLGSILDKARSLLSVYVESDISSPVANRLLATEGDGDS